MQSTLQCSVTANANKLLNQMAYKPPSFNPGVDMAKNCEEFIKGDKPFDPKYMSLELRQALQILKDPQYFDIEFHPPVEEYSNGERIISTQHTFLLRAVDQLYQDQFAGPLRTTVEHQIINILRSKLIPLCHNSLPPATHLSTRAFVLNQLPRLLNQVGEVNYWVHARWMKGLLRISQVRLLQLMISDLSHPIDMFVMEAGTPEAFEKIWNVTNSLATTIKFFGSERFRSERLENLILMHVAEDGCNTGVVAAIAEETRVFNQQVKAIDQSKLSPDEKLQAYNKAGLSRTPLSHQNRWHRPGYDRDGYPLNPPAGSGSGIEDATL
ncbi:hypothetical protein BJ508DRAFT_417091 [Ascobolus immersus RN42]|uniref:Uncharacterized protein n=1 Tax=Ascobolus immersus RN42 TaxID=1160509 RepID=A0A3N4HW90_ASCIM|nr:hypothetical protein BJ508DRAFT_417091 [Ascobolus immersus RN42]